MVERCQREIDKNN
jgi:hypothetical protein